MSSAAWSRFSRAFAEDFDAITARISQRLVGELPSFSEITADEMCTMARDGMSALVPAVAEQRRLSGHEFDVYDRTTEEQAAHGVQLDEMVTAWNIGTDELRTWAGERVKTEEEIGPEVFAPFHDVIVPWGNQGVRLSIAWYQARERGRLRADAFETECFVRGVLLGEMEHLELKLRARAHGLDTSAGYHALRAPDAASNLGRVAAWLGLTGPGHARRGVVAAVDGSVWGFAAALPTEPIGIPVGMSGAVRLADLPHAFRYASRALGTALALDLKGRHDVASLGIHPAVLDDDDVGDELVERFVAPLERLGSPGGDLLHTVRAFLDNNCRYEPTGKALFVHANTVRYRIKRFEELTGAALDEVSSLVLVWWAIERRRLQRSP